MGNSTQYSTLYQSVCKLQWVDAYSEDMMACPPQAHLGEEEEIKGWLGPRPPDGADSRKSCAMDNSGVACVTLASSHALVIPTHVLTMLAVSASSLVVARP